MYNNGQDSIIGSFKPVDKIGRSIPTSILSVNFYSTDKDKTGMLTPNGFKATLKTTISPRYYDLSITMINYNAWQPEKVQYEVHPVSGVLLATLEISPKLCALETSNVFRVPLTYARIDAGVLSGVIVKIYSINN